MFSGSCIPNHNQENIVSRDHLLLKSIADYCKLGKSDFSEMELQIRVCNKMVKYCDSKKRVLIFKLHNYDKNLKF